MEILITGGAGYLGSHICVELAAKGHKVIVLDNLSNSSPLVIKRVRDLAGVTEEQIIFYESDLQERKILREILGSHNIDSVIHLAGLKSVNESVESPISYYTNNVAYGLVLIDEMKNAGVKNIVFSSSCAVYSEPISLPISEKSPVGQTASPYGSTKFFFETILRDIFESDSSWNIAVLRYFNPVGAHPSGRIGESPLTKVPNNLMPYICHVAADKYNKGKLQLHGCDYPTKDGTGVRDYIHVVDLALGHVVAMDYLNENSNSCITVNLGRGVGVSVLEMIKAFEEISGVKLPYEFLDRRAGDVAEVYASVDYAKELLGWSAKYDLEKMCLDSWNWKCLNPDGYK